MKTLTRKQAEESLTENTFILSVSGNDVAILADLDFGDIPKIEEFSHWSLDTSMPLIDAINKCREEHSGDIGLIDFDSEEDAKRSLMTYTDNLHFLELSRDEAIGKVFKVRRGNFMVVIP